jgi:hypothetical protein
MGQITEAQVGITVSLPIHFDNIVLHLPKRKMRQSKTYLYIL